MPKLRHFDNLGTARFVTFSSYRREACLLRAGIPELFIKHTHEVRKKHLIKIFGYVIMPEHVHLVLLPPDGLKLGLVIREIKSKMAREYFATVMSEVVGQRIFWQTRCYDHNCRSTESVREKINYCHLNPVKRGLVGQPGEYRWSSYNWFQGVTDVPFEMDGCEL